MIDIRKKIEEAYQEQIGDEPEMETDIVKSKEVVEDGQESEPDKGEVVDEESGDGGEAEPVEEEDVQLEEEVPQTDYAALIHPQPLNEEERALFDQLPNKESKKLVRDLVTRLKISHQQTMTRKLNQLNGEYEKTVSKYKDLDNLQSQYKNRFTDGATLKDVAENALAWDEALDSNPVAAITELMQQYGVTPQHLVGHVPYQAHTPAKSPELSNLEQEIAALKEERQQEKAKQIISAIDRDLEIFVSSKDESGQKRYPLVDYVAQPMSDWVKVLRQQHPEATNFQLLHAAYHNAIAANPELKSLLPSKTKPQEKKPAKEPTSLTSKATAKAVKQPNKKRSIREIAEEAYAQLSE